MHPHIVTDLKFIAEKAKENHKENFAFRVFLKNINEDKTDRFVKKINAEVSSKIDCT